MNVKNKLDRLLIELAAKWAGVSITNDANDTMIKALRERATDAIDKAESIQANADAEERELTPEECSEIDKLNTISAKAMDSVERRTAVLANKARMTRPAAMASDAGVDVGAARSVDLPGQHRGNIGFHNMGEFATTVFNASRAIRHGNGSMVDARLTNVTTGSSEGTDADGGFAVPPDFREEIQRIITAEGTLYGGTDMYDTARNEITFPKDETTPWNTTGIQARRKTELAQATQDKVALLEHKITLHNMIVLAPVSEELLDDAPAIGSYLQRKAPEVIGWKIEDELMNGTGTGQMEGVLTSAAGIEIAKEAAQVADTVVFENVAKMLGRLPQRFWAGAKWQAPQTALVQLMSMEFPGDSSPVFLPANNAAGRPFNTLFGLPLTFTEAAPALGDAGDITLVGWRQYSTGQKVGGVKAAMSAHLFFDWDAVAFKFTLRNGGLNWLDAAYTSNDGSTTYSNIIKLAARA